MHRRLLHLARDVRLPLAGTAACGLLAGLLAIASAWELSGAVEAAFLGSRTLGEVAAALRLVMLLAVLRALLAWAGEVSAGALAVRIKNELRRRLFEKLLQLGPAYTRGERAGELAAAGAEGIEALDAYFGQYLPQLALAALVPPAILLAAFPLDPLSGLILFLTAPLIPLFMILIGKAGESLTRRQWDTLRHLSGHFLESLQGLTTLKLFGRSRQRARSLDEANRRFRDVTLGVLRVTFLSALALEWVATLSTAVIAVEVGLRLLYGQMAFHQAFFLLLLAPEFYLPLRTLGMRFHAGTAGTAAARRIFEILDAPLGEGRAEARAAEAQPPAAIAFESVSFTYPGAAAPALQALSFEIRRGQHVAMVGASGAGKSTLAALLLRFVEPDSGSIRIDGRPLAEVPAAAWRELVAWVPQKPYLFPDTILANLRLARPNASDEELRAAVRAAHLERLISSLPDGYETVIGEEGARLSAGQAQRLALARAFLKGAPILILDEPTSGLDPQQEALLAASTRRLMHGRTVVTIAHRLNTVFEADRILVLDCGRLVEAGSHRELMTRSGAYARLVGARARLPARLTELHPGQDTDQAAPADSGPAPARPAGRPVRPVLTRLLGFLSGSWKWVALSVLLGVLTVAAGVGLMGASAYLIAAAALQPPFGTLQLAVVGVRFFGLARGLLRYAERLVSHEVTFRLLARVRGWFYRALEPLAPARLAGQRAGDLLSRLAADVETLEGFYVRLLAPPLAALAVAAGMVSLFASLNAAMAAAYLAFLILIGLGIPLLTLALGRRPTDDLAGRRRDLYAALVGGVQGLADLLVYGGGRSALDSLEAAGAASGRAQRRLASVLGLQNGLSILLTSAGTLAALALTVPLVDAGILPGPWLAVVPLMAAAGFEGVLALGPAGRAWAASLEAARRLFEIADARPEIPEPGPTSRRTEAGSRRLDSRLRVSGLGLSYPARPQPALEAVDFTLPPGGRVALVGASGAGKTSLASVLLRFWDYSTGQVRLGGWDLRSLDPARVRRLFAAVPQSPFFFDESILENLRLGRPTARLADVERAARRACIHDFIASLPAGYRTVMGERGQRLSGGERQRLAIARALLMDAPILLLDEPTANLDPGTEHRVLESLLRPEEDRSILLMTHRLVGLEAMDEILVLEAGRIVERGAHAELLERSGAYRRMWDVQSRILAA
jgi:ATP-binding cassette subfamily C protein CydCD